MLPNDDTPVTLRARTPRDLGIAIRDARLEQCLTQAQLATRARVGRDWITRLEQGNSPRLEIGLIFNVLNVLGLQFAVEPTPKNTLLTPPDTTER